MRQFGMDALRQIGAESDGRWVIPQEARDNQNDAAPDRFIVCGDHYGRLRELMTEVFLGKSTEALIEALTNLGGRNDFLERDLMLAFYREITSNAGHTRRQTAPQILYQLSDWCQTCSRIRNKSLAEALVRNTLIDRLQVTSNGAPLDRALAEAVIHFKILMHGARENGLTQPLLSLIRAANTMASRRHAHGSCSWRSTASSAHPRARHVGRFNCRAPTTSSHVDVSRCNRGLADYGGDALLATKQSRQTWENAFVNSYVTPVLRRLDHHLLNANNSLVNDNRLGVSLTDVEIVAEYFSSAPHVAVTPQPID